MRYSLGHLESCCGKCFLLVICPIQVEQTMMSCSMWQMEEDLNHQRNAPNHCKFWNVWSPFQAMEISLAYCICISMNFQIFNHIIILSWFMTHIGIIVLKVTHRSKGYTFYEPGLQYGNFKYFVKLFVSIKLVDVYYHNAVD